MYVNPDAKRCTARTGTTISGNPMSHGCINLPLPVADFLYGWAPIGTPVTGSEGKPHGPLSGQRQGHGLNQEIELQWAFRISRLRGGFPPILRGAPARIPHDYAPCPSEELMRVSPDAGRTPWRGDDAQFDRLARAAPAPPHRRGVAARVVATLGLALGLTEGSTQTTLRQNARRKEETEEAPHAPASRAGAKQPPHVTAAPRRLHARGINSNCGRCTGNLVCIFGLHGLMLLCGGACCASTEQCLQVPLPPVSAHVQRALLHRQTSAASTARSVALLRACPRCAAQGGAKCVSC